MNETPEMLAGLSLAEKRLLLAELLRERAGRPGPDVITFPLSEGQRGLWYLAQLDPRSDAYNVCYPSRVRSPIDVDALRRALQMLMDRHPSLRTTFEHRDGDLHQRVHERPPLPFEAVDASAWSEGELRARIEQEAHRPFDLERGPLVRMHLFTRAPDDHVFLMSVHHIVGDFWSLVVVVEEMKALYPASLRGEPDPLPPPDRHYRDFVRWQAETLSGPEGDRLRDYWDRTLAGAPAVLDLPTDRPRPPVLGHRGGSVPWRVGPDLSRRLRAVASAERATLYSALLAAFQVMLGRHAGADDFLVGAPFVGRNRPGFEGVVGYFINMLPLRADLSGDPTFRALLRRVGATVLGALEHQDYPFARIVERRRIARDPSRTPLVQISFTLDRAHRAGDVGTWQFFTPSSGAAFEVGGLRLEPYPIAMQNSQSDLEMVAEEAGDSVGGMLRYNADLFEHASIERMVGQFLKLLEAAAEDPGRRLSELPLMTDAERRAVLDEWNRTDADFPGPACLHELFERQAALTPDADAVTADDGTLTYAELDARADSLASRLRRLGVGPGVLAALVLDRSTSMIVAMLGVLKAGGAYVPLDPTAPDGRLSILLAETGAPVLLTQGPHSGRLAGAGLTVVRVDADEPDADGAEPAGARATVDDLAYVLFTSGSTGRPKGVMVEHRAIYNTLAWRGRDLPLGPDDRVLQQVPYTFDPSVGLIFASLMTGARLVLAAPGEEYDPYRLVNRMAREGVTVLDAPPAQLQAILAEPRLDACRSTLRRVCCGGEAMPPGLPARLFERLDAELFNMYGPTEAAIDVTAWHCRPGGDRPTVPIGRPIANVRAYVLDPDGRPVPPGVPGELHIAGAGLARGYLNDPAQTAERFIPDPFSDAPNARMYRTGDRCRWLGDGVLEFLGRLDDQVKLRGYRIEPAEIESALLAHPDVREAAVIASADASGEPRLVAYVAGEAEADSLRQHLKGCLPVYMIPARFVAMSELPRTTAGKLDRRALPEPPAERPETARPFRAPRNALEAELAELCRDVLRIDRVGVDDNFFELGGSSIQGAILIQRLQGRLDEPVSVISLFDAPTVSGLAELLGRAYPGAVARRYGADCLPDGQGPEPGPPGVLVPMQAEGSAPPCFMVHPPGGIVICYQALAHRLGRDRPFYAVRSRGLHGREELPPTLEAMAADYVAEVRRVRPSGPYHLGGWSAGGVVALEMARQLMESGEQIALLALLDSTPPVLPDGPSGDHSGREYGIDIPLEDLADLGPEGQLPYLWDHALKLGLIDEDVPMEVARQVLDDLKALFHHHMVLVNNYRPKPYPGPVTLFRPREAPLAVPSPSDRGWGAWVRAVEVYHVPGQHHSMVKEPHVGVLAEALAACLRRTDEGG